VANINWVKKAMVVWDSQKRKNDGHVLLDSEAELSSIYESEYGGYSSIESREALLQLEQKKRESYWRKRKWFGD